MEPVDYEVLPAEGKLRLKWSDGDWTDHSMADLRRLCPCAHCKTEREKMQMKNMLRVIQGPARQNEAVILKVHPVGRYALRFDWNDQHSTGIYSYEFLREHRL